MGEMFRAAMRWINTLNMHEWMYVLLFTVFFGVLCMRGYGSRHNY